MKHLLLASVLLVACGASVEQQQPVADTGSDAVAADAGADVAADPCKYPTGAPICSSTCKQGSECDPCLNMQDQSGAVIPYGICGGIEVKTGVMLSGFCGRCANPSHLCAIYQPDDLRCIDASFCEKAVRDGFSVPCRWQDATPYALGQSIPTVACPMNGKPLGLCGGGCGLECAPKSYCIGMSPTHPIGICAAPRRDSGDTTTCARPTGCLTGEACLVHKVDAASQSVADAQGVCVPLDRCRNIAAVLPGGVYCTGAGGADLL